MSEASEDRKREGESHEGSRALAWTGRPDISVAVVDILVAWLLGCDCHYSTEKRMMIRTETESACGMDPL